LKNLEALRILFRPEPFLYLVFYACIMSAFHLKVSILYECPATIKTM